MANIIFDFDGTIADTFGLAVELYEQLLRGGEPMPLAEVERLRGLSTMRVAMELRVRPWRLPYLIARGKRLMHKHIGTVEIFAGMPEVIRALHVQGHTLYVMSSNSVANIRSVLRRYELLHEFTGIYGNAGMLSKATLLRGLVRRRKLTLADTYYIGDEVRDIEAARRAGMKIVSVSWGYNNEQILRHHKPDYLAVKPADIQNIFKVTAKQ